MGELPSRIASDNPYDRSRLPQGGYFLTPEFHMWPDVREAGPYAIGTYVALSIWGTAYGYDEHVLPRLLLRAFRSSRTAAKELVRVGLWTEAEEGYEHVTLAQLQVRRGYRGTTMPISRLIPESPAGHRAGIAAFGAWALAASWSLTTFYPGFIPREAVRRLGLTAHVPRLCSRDFRGSALWERVPGGYWMAQGDHPLEARWIVAPGNERLPVPDDIRRSVFGRDGYKCVRCGSTEDLALDHIYPWSLGGPDSGGNLQVLCRSCNSAKGARVEVVQRGLMPPREARKAVLA